MFHTIVSIKNDGHYFCRAGGNRPDGLNEPVTHELEHALNETCEALVRAMHLSILVQENPLANTTGHQGYVAPDKAVMQQVKSSLEQKIKQMQISLTGEPVLRLTGLSAATLPHMDYEVAGTPAQRKVWQDKIDQQGAVLKARGLLS